MSRAFLRGMASINLFPAERDISFPSHKITIVSDKEAFEKDIQAVANDMWNAMSIVHNKIEKENT